jgi:hypothetical protein
MPALIRRRYPERKDCWHVCYGDVHVGTIAIHYRPLPFADISKRSVPQPSLESLMAANVRRRVQLRAGASSLPEASG